MKHIIVLCGPSGCGKSTVGSFLSENRDFDFLEGEQVCDGFSNFPLSRAREQVLSHYNLQYQSREFVEKSKFGSAMNGLDHAMWLRDLSRAAIDATSKHEVVVVSCLALKRTHRNYFRSAVIDHNKINEKPTPKDKIKLHFLFLQISQEKAQILLEQRQLRDNDYLSMNRVQDQYQALEVPRGGDRGELSIDCTIIDAGKGIEWMLKSVEDILEAFLS